MVRILSIKVGIIGAGPAGLASALYLKRSGINTTIFTSSAPGGQLLTIPSIENYLGFENISGTDLAIKMLKQVEDVEIKQMNVKNIYKKNNKFIISDNKNEFSFDKIIIATGQSKKKINSDLKGISYCALCDGFFYKNKVVAVIGGGASAVTEALYLSNICSKVYLIARSKLKADNKLKSKINEKIEVIENATIEVNGDVFLESITLNNEKTISLDGLFVAVGNISNLDFLENVNVSVKNSKIVVDEKMETSEKGIYACGDVILKDYYQIISAVNEGMVAALTISERMNV